MRRPRRRSSVWSTPMTIGPEGTKAATTIRSKVRASARLDQALRLSTRWKAAKPGCSARPRTRRPGATVKGGREGLEPVDEAGRKVRLGADHGGPAGLWCRGSELVRTREDRRA